LRKRPKFFNSGGHWFWRLHIISRIGFLYVPRPLTKGSAQKHYLILYRINEAFFVYIEAGFFCFANIIVFHLYQLEFSRRPHSKEKKYVTAFCFFSTLLFISGVLFGFYCSAFRLWIFCQFY